MEGQTKIKNEGVKMAAKYEDPAPDMEHPPGRCEDCDRYRLAKIAAAWKRQSKGY